jgi:predicted RNase H-like HicB family nuclease
MKYLIVIEPTTTGFSAYSPDVPGCVATAATREEVEREMREAIAFHLDGLREDGAPVPRPQSSSTYVDVPA